MNALDRLTEIEEQIKDLLATADATEKEAQDMRAQAEALAKQVSLASQIKKEIEEKLEEERNTVKSLAENFRGELDDEKRSDFDAILQCAGIEFEVEADENESPDEGGAEDSEEIVQLTG